MHRLKKHISNLDVLKLHISECSISYVMFMCREEKCSVEKEEEEEIFPVADA